jgi:hypothetical protein
MLIPLRIRRFVALCEMHEIDPKLAIGGAYVSWHGTMQWDKEDGEQHAGKRCLRWCRMMRRAIGTAFKREGLCGNCSGGGGCEMDEEDVGWC